MEVHMASLRGIKREADREKKLVRQQEREQALLAAIDELKAQYGTDPDFLVKISDALNERGMRTITGKPWTPGNLWAWLQKPRVSTSIRAENKAAGTVRAGAEEVLAVSQRLAEVASVLLSTTRGEETKKKIVPFLIDEDLFVLVEKKMELEQIQSLSDLNNFLYRAWLAGDVLSEGIHLLPKRKNATKHFEAVEEILGPFKEDPKS
jgi:hypothetical protein